MSSKVKPVEGRVGVLLVNTGTPAEPTPKAVKGYLSRFLSNRRIAPMNRLLWWPILHFCILPKRKVASAKKYQQIWTAEGSPLEATQEKLARGLENSYQEQGLDVVVRSAMSFSQPDVYRGVKALKKAGCSSLVVLPLYPQSAYSTTGVVEDDLKRALRRSHWKGSATLVPNYGTNPEYIRVIAASIARQGFDAAAGDRLLFSFHSIPLKDIEAGDTYELQVGATALAVAGELELERTQWTLGYQCRFDKGRQLLSPFTKNTLSTWADTGMRQRAYIVCPNFSIDCLETLYDLPYEIIPAYQEACARADQEAGVQDPHPAELIYVPCLNASKAHLRVLESVLEPYIQSLV